MTANVTVTEPSRVTSVVTKVGVAVVSPVSDTPAGAPLSIVHRYVYVPAGTTELPNSLVSPAHRSRSPFVEIVAVVFGSTLNTIVNGSPTQLSAEVGVIVYVST